MYQWLASHQFLILKEFTKLNLSSTSTVLKYGIISHSTWVHVIRAFPCAVQFTVAVSYSKLNFWICLIVYIPSSWISWGNFTRLLPQGNNSLFAIRKWHHFEACIFCENVSTLMKALSPAKERRKSALEGLANFDIGSVSQKELSAVTLSGSDLLWDSKLLTLWSSA